QVMGPDRFKVLEGSVPSLDRAGQDTLKRWFVCGAGWWVTPDTWNTDTLSHEYGPPSEPVDPVARSEEHTSELQSRFDLVCRLLPPRPLRLPPSLHDALPISGHGP